MAKPGKQEKRAKAAEGKKGRGQAPAEPGKAGKQRGKPRGVRNQELGRRGERAAAAYLERLGYEILELNWECPAGEADIIARDYDVLAFIEVKTRSNFEKGFPCEAVDAAKRARYEKIALWYLRDYPYVDIPVRFDIVDIVAVTEDRALMRHYVNAFGQGCC